MPYLIPENVYGVIDLYGQAAQASIIDVSECHHRSPPEVCPALPGMSGLNLADSAITTASYSTLLDAAAAGATVQQSG